MTESMDVVTKRNYCVRLVEGMGAMYQSGSPLFHDMKLSVENRLFLVHRVILSAASPYFYALFAAGFEETGRDVISIYDIPSEVMNKVLEFIYTGSTDISKVLVEDLLSAADMLQLPELVAACGTFLKLHLDTSDCLRIYLLADAHGITDLRDSAEAFVNAHFLDVVRHEDFHDFPFEDLCHFLVSEDLRIDMEHQVLTAVISWLTANIDERRPHAVHLFQLVRLHLIHHTSMERCIESCTDEGLRHILARLTLDVFERGEDLNSTLDHHVLSVLPRAPRKRSRRTVYVVGGYTRLEGARWTDNQVLKTVECLDSLTHEWTAGVPLLVQRSGFGIATLEGDGIYVIGGEDNSLISSSVERYDPFSESWTMMPGLSEPRSQLGACTCRGRIYVFGGWVGSEIGATIEVFNRSTMEWTAVDVIQKERLRVAMGVVEYQDLIYIVGGMNEHGIPTKSVESYNPVTRGWTRLASMKTGRANLGVASYEGFIYAVGGWYDDDVALASVEKYSIEQDCWYKVEPMSTARAGAAVAALGGCLYVLGGRRNNHNYQAPSTLATTEVFNISTNTWNVERTCDSMPTSRCEAAVAVL